MSHLATVPSTLTMPVLSALLLFSATVAAPTSGLNKPQPKPAIAKPKLGAADLFGAGIPETPVPAGYGRYCSLSYPSGGWAFDWGSVNDDPCATMLASSPGGTIARAGLYSLSGDNNVVVRCGGEVWLYGLPGTQALRTAIDAHRSKTHCVYTVAPRVLPIFDRPHAADESKMKRANGFDFARGYTLESNAGTQQSCLNSEGNSCSFNGHDGYDWSMPAGTTIRSVAAGKVLVARDRDVQSWLNKGCAGTPPSPNSSRFQKEVYVVHRVGRGDYAEVFVTYYAHLSTMDVSNGQTVTRSQKLGEAGTTGCSTGDHLHFEVTRFTNTAAAYRRPYQVPTTEDYDRTSMIDPYGFTWHGRTNFDPWAWRAYASGDGALSIDLWRSGQRPYRW